METEIINNTDSEFPGYQERTISLTLANVLSFVFIVILFGLTFAIFFLMQKNVEEPHFDELLYMFLFLVAGIVVHELIHGFFWGISAPNRFRDISFGIFWKALTPYCHCKEPLGRNKYLIGAIAPLLILGVIPWVAGIVVGSILIALFGALFIVAAIGDIMVALKVIKEDPNTLLLDHPSKGGYLVKSTE